MVSEASQRAIGLGPRLSGYLLVACGWACHLTLILTCLLWEMGMEVSYLVACHGD